ncbi:glycosyltransferase family 32 protein [Zalerion maritima]|uniref:Glycosyltransferase family 32 protein n=1 Tax=Zalerion maritima TaxID=339359 RepID=A0AAD5RRQ0_9PEZI|nr:glycosyltransferase family 32 protein [Zalerion maritima]
MVATMRRRKAITYFILANAFTVGILIHVFWPLICLLFLKGEKDRITLPELQIELPPSAIGANGKPIAQTAAASSPTSPTDAPSPPPAPIIPKIIHQTWLTCPVPDLLSGNCTTKPIPEKWVKAQKSVQDFNEEYEYKLWSDKDSREFLEERYPWFLPTWDTYQYPVQRADAIRYFALHHYGGIYIDLDDGCLRRLDPLLAFPAWVRRTRPTGIGNDVIGAVPGHPFIEKAIKALQSYDMTWPTPYITIMASTGPLFFSLLWRHYNDQLDRTSEDAEDRRIRLLFWDEYMNTDWSFFIHYKGRSWHQWDANAFLFMRHHWIELTILGFATGFLVIFGLWWLGNFISRKRIFNRAVYGYMPVKEAEH